MGAVLRVGRGEEERGGGEVERWGRVPSLSERGLGRREGGRRHGTRTCTGRRERWWWFEVEVPVPLCAREREQDEGKRTNEVERDQLESRENRASTSARNEFD